MRVSANNIEKNNNKQKMDELFVCVKDKSLSITERNKYYAEYIKLAEKHLIFSKNQ